MKTKNFHRIVSLLLIMFTVTGCSLVEFPSQYDINATVDTGQGVLDSINAAKEALIEAEKKAGEVASDAAKEIITTARQQLEGFTADVIKLVGDQLNEKIADLDKRVEATLVWISSETDQIHKYALDIIRAGGGEARLIIEEAGRGMQKTIREIDDSSNKTIFGFTASGVLFVNTVADRILSIGGWVLGLLLAFIATFKWGQLIFVQKGLPEKGLQRTLAFVLMAASFVFAVAPFTLVYRPIRAYALTSAGQSTEIQLSNLKEQITYRPPHVDDFVPHIVVASKDHLAEGLILKGSYLSTSLGVPMVTFGDTNLTVGGSDDELLVDIEPAINNPLAGNKILIRFGGPGTPTVEYSIPVQTATPTPTPTPTPTYTSVPTDTPTPMPTNISTPAYTLIVSDACCGWSGMYL
ncbi:MAG: hypothetical protein DWI57_00805 [Chloroflexi bacterium]|nr:MAG: hypothetical protein DWI57_00805 [Chloroflexota bacterium]